MDIKNDPVILILTGMFPKEFILKTAKETGAFKRLRLINPVVFFWILVLGAGVNLLREIRVIKREYEREANKTLSISSFYDRFTKEMAEFFHQCVIHAIEVTAQEAGLKLGGKLKNFKDILMQDSSIIRLHESLAKTWPAARSRKVAAGIKISCIVSAVANGVKSVSIVPERTSEIKTLKIGSWVKDRIFLIDLGFFKYGMFDKIDKLGGYFVSRLKENANPEIISISRSSVKGKIELEGRKIKEVLPHLKGGILDAIVEVTYKKGKYKGKQRAVTRAFRLVAVFNDETKKYHLYLTNIDIEVLKAEDIAALYSARWEIEMVFKELKSHYRLDEISTKKPEIIECLVWISILTLLCSRRINTFIRSIDPDNSKRYTHLRWAKIFMESSRDLLRMVLKSMDIELSMMEIYNVYLGQAIDPNVNRKRLMDEWIA